MLAPKLSGFAVLVELTFRAVPEFDIRAADVGAVLSDRWRTACNVGDLFAAPELVIEVKSPSNTKAELQERASLCLTHGSLEFWIVDEEHRSIAVFHRDGSKAVYSSGEAVPLSAFAPGSLSADEVFS